MLGVLEGSGRRAALVAGVTALSAVGVAPLAPANPATGPARAPSKCITDSPTHNGPTNQILASQDR